MHRVTRTAILLDTTLVDALQDPAAFDHETGRIELIETHISWLLLAGEYVYKIKKPLVLDFLDFGTLEKRRHFCEEEIRLNKPSAPSIYLDVVPVTQDGDQPRFGGTGAAIEYAVRMRRFDQSLRLDTQLEHGKLTVEDMRELAANIARRHLEAPGLAASERDRFVAQTKEFIWDNFAALDGTIDRGELDRLRDWTGQELDKLGELLWQRFDEGFVRDCHGDLHLGNLVRLPGGITTFDCIEFNADLRNIDVFCDIAFLIMDLVARERHDLAAHFLNRYLERTGDYGGVAFLDLYFVYRCLVRAKVAAILSQEHEAKAEREPALAEANRYVAMALRQISKPAPVLIVMCGLSGSGKTWVSGRLMAALPAIRIRSDIERKRMHGLDETADSASGVGEGIYTPRSTREVYGYLNAVAATILDADHNVILDAAFLDAESRRQAFRTAADCGCAAVLLEVRAPEELLRERVGKRAAGNKDASEARLEVLRHQIETAEPLDAAEMERTVLCDSGGEVDIDALTRDIRRLAGEHTKAPG